MSLSGVLPGRLGGTAVRRTQSDDGEMRTHRRHADTATTVALASAQTVVVAVVIAIGSLPQGGAPPTAYLLAVASGGIVLAAEPFPVPALAVSVGTVIVYYILDLPPIGVAVPILGTVYLTALAGHVAAASVAAVTLVVLATYFRAAEGGESSSLLAYDTVTNLALVAATVALAAMVSARRAAAHQQRRILELERRALDRRLDAERLRMSRELHDSLGHRLATIAVYAAVAAEAHNDDGRSTALQHVHEGTRTALDELRSTVRAVRIGMPSPADIGEVDDAGSAIAAATAALEAAGFVVERTVSVDAPDLPAPVRRVAVRIVQEAVTNVLKHSRATHVRLSLGHGDGVCVLRVADNGAAGPFVAGAGIRGMHERTAELDGTLTVRADASGFVVEARVPSAVNR
jgi:signal transduction histidine kinase